MSLSTAATQAMTEADRAQAKYGDFTSSHEALGVLSEEMDELKAAIHGNALYSIEEEALHVAAVALRLVEHCSRGAATAFAARSGIVQEVAPGKWVRR